MGGRWEGSKNDGDMGDGEGEDGGTGRERKRVGRGERGEWRERDIRRWRRKEEMEREGK